MDESRSTDPFVQSPKWFVKSLLRLRKLELMHLICVSMSWYSSVGPERFVYCIQLTLLEPALHRYPCNFRVVGFDPTHNSGLFSTVMVRVTVDGICSSFNCSVENESGKYFATSGLNGLFPQVPNVASASGLCTLSTLRVPIWLGHALSSMAIRLYASHNTLYLPSGFLPHTFPEYMIFFLHSGWFSSGTTNSNVTRSPTL